MRNRIIIPIVIMLSSFIVTGCATTKPQLAQHNDAPKEIKLDTLEFSNRHLKTLPLKVAILPFENTTTSTQATDIVRKTFYNYFASKRYKDIELFEIDEMLKGKDIYKDNRFNDQASWKIGRLLQADGLVYGKIIGFDRTFLGIYSQVSVELEVWLVDASSGQTVWKAQHKATTHEGSVPLDPISLIPAIYRSSMKMRSIELVRTSEDLCRTISLALPEPEIIKWQDNINGKKLAAITFD